MNLKEYLDKLQDLYEKEGNLELCYSIDDEGNGYCRGVFCPEVRVTNEDGYNFDTCVPLEEFKQEYVDCVENDEKIYPDGWVKVVLIN